MTTQTDLPTRRTATIRAVLMLIAAAGFGIDMHTGDWSSVISMVLFPILTLWGVVIAVYAWKVAPR
jgi:hypothetical protein